MQSARKVGSLLVLGILFLSMAGQFCFASAQQMNAKQMACCASKPCHQSAKNEDCCTHMSDGQQLKAELTNVLHRPNLAPVTVVIGTLPAAYHPSALLEIAAMEHAPPLPLYTIYHSLLI